MYKQVTEEVVGLIVEALQALNRPVTLQSIRSNLTPDALRGLVGDLARSNRADLAEEAKAAAARGRLAAEAMETMRSRIGNLMRSFFAPVLTNDAGADRELVLDDALHEGVTYISLPAVAASEDVPLFGRVLLQDLKQAVARREQLLGVWSQRLPRTMETAVASARIGNVLLVIDEFAGLREPDQIQDLLLQARSAGVSVALSSQLLPQDSTLAAAVKGVSMVAALRLNDADAQQVADLIGTYHGLEMTTQTGVQAGGVQATGLGSIQEVEKYIAHPNSVNSLPDASAVIKLDRTMGRGRFATAVRFWPPEADWPETTKPPRRFMRAEAPAALGAQEEDLEAPAELPEMDLREPDEYPDLPRLPEPPSAADPASVEMPTMPQ